MNKVIVLIFTLSLIVLLVSCKDTKTNTDDSTHPSAETTEPTVEQTSDRISDETDAPESSANVPDAWHIFEYDGVKYDLWEIYSELQGVWEWGRIGKYVVAEAWINKDTALFALINTETQKIEHHFAGTVMTCHSDDINTIVYARDNTIYSFDGSLFVDLVLGAGEYIRELTYAEDGTKIIVTMETPVSVQTETIDLTLNVENFRIGSRYDELALRYKVFPGIVRFTPGDKSIFDIRSKELAADIGAYFQEYANDMASRPPIMYYLVHRKGLTPSQMRDYYRPNVNVTVHPTLIDSLFIADVEEAKRALMTDYAFYADGKVYTFYEVYNAEMTENPLFDITEADHAATWWNIYDYLLHQKGRDEHGHAHSSYIEYLPYVEGILKENFTTITDLSDWERLGFSKEYNATYRFLWNLISGESEIPEYNGLGIKEYSLTRMHESIGTTVAFTFTVTGNSLPETLPPGTYTKIIGETVDVYLYDGKEPETWEEYEEEDRINKGLDTFGDNPAVQAVNTYLCWMPYIWEVSPYGEWDMANYHLPYNYICAYYGTENLEIRYDELQRLMSEKFGIAVERPTENPFILSRCRYNPETDTVQYADTRGYEPVHRILDCKEVDGTAYVTVQLFADRLYLIPSHKVVYKIGAGEVFLGYEITQTGNYEPRELS